MGMEADVEIKFHTDKLLSEMEKKAEKALMSVGLEAEGDAKLEIESAPRRVDTGRLRNSITWATQTNHSVPRNTSGDEANEARPEDRCPNAEDGRSVLIGTNVEYAVYVHEGTKHSDPNRFLRNAVERNYEKYRQIIDDVMREED